MHVPAKHAEQDHEHKDHGAPDQARQQERGAQAVGRRLLVAGGSVAAVVQIRGVGGDLRANGVLHGPVVKSIQGHQADPVGGSGLQIDQAQMLLLPTDDALLNDAPD